jgi:hypothetical protein
MGGGAIDMTTIPGWLVVVSAVSVILHSILALIIAFDVALAHCQKMWIMNLVRPVTALHGGLVALWTYYRVGLASAHHRKTGEPFRPSAGKSRSGREACTDGWPS